MNANGRSNSMKPSSKRLTTTSKKGGSQAAAAAPARANTPPATSKKVYGVPGRKAVKAKITGGEQQAGVFLAFAGSSVMAHDAVMKGVSGRALTRIWESTKGALPSELFLRAIGVSARTAHRIKSDPDRPLDARIADGIYRLESVRMLAQEVLGGEQAADEWLNTAAIGLGFRKPIDLLSTSPGAEAVKTLLQRMKCGVYA
jgi:putative toxin-antitoxin system antitoxin component (TIGR02293 family)